MAIRAPVGVPTAPEEVIYPDSDGQGMPDGDPLQLYDVGTGKRLLTREERLEQEAAARREAEAEVERLRAKLARLREEGE